MKSISLLFVFLFSATVFAQSPNKSDKLTTDQGFNLLKIGALYSKVKSVLQKDTMDRKTSLEPKAQTIKYTDKIYLVDLKKTGYAQFCGKNIARIEVWFQKHYAETGDDGNDFEISEVKIFFKVVSDKDSDAFIDKVLLTYGNPASGGEDFPEPGYSAYTWFSPLVLINMSNYYGDPFTEDPKRDYLKIEFSSAVGG